MTFRAVLVGCGAMSHGWLEAIASPVDEAMPLAAHFENVGTGTLSDEEIAWLKHALQTIGTNLETLDEPPGKTG